MKQAARDVARNRLGLANQAQQEGANALEQVVKALEDRREEELDRLIKKLRDADKKLAELTEDQELLQKKVKDAARIADPEKRAEELKRLAREQDRLRKESQEMVRQLTRLRADRAREALSRAGGDMEDAGQSLERGEEGQDPQDDALDRLDEARREVERAREEAEEELAREKLAKVADLLRRIKERQEALLPESARIHREVLERKGWDRALLASLNDLAAAQEGLGKEAASLADGKLKGAVVFTRLLGRSADLMQEAADSMTERVEKARGDGGELNAKDEEVADRKTQELQREALRRLEQLIEALQPDKGVAQRPAKQPPAGGNGGSGAEGDGIPQLAQLKALKALQQDVNRRTEAFARKNPGSEKLTKDQKKELEGLRRDQAEVAELLDELTAPAGEEGAKP
jgi:hypothetical protein